MSDLSVRTEIKGTPAKPLSTMTTEGYLWVVLRKTIDIRLTDSRNGRGGNDHALSFEYLEWNETQDNVRVVPSFVDTCVIDNKRLAMKAAAQKGSDWQALPFLQALRDGLVKQ